jgi:hypothetical protein
MSPDNKNEPIKITLDDLARVETVGSSVTTATPGKIAGGAKVYGSVGEAADQRVEAPEERGSILLQGWFYLGTAGLIGATLAWAIAETGFIDQGGRRWGNLWMMPMVVTLQCVGFAIAESLVERSAKKALVRGLLALPLGVVLAFVFDFAAEIIFRIGVTIAAGAGAQSFRNPAFWVARGVAWMVFGAAGGVVYGIVGQSSKKTLYGALGGIIGAGIGGMIFDPIAMISKGGATSRAVGFALLGVATGVAIGLVESALKDRWLYVTAGPLAGKQFILYKARTLIGSDQKCDIYLFKDPNVLGKHAVVEIAGTRVQLRALGPAYVSGQPARLQVLQSGNSVQIGRYSFRYSERQRK